MQIAHGKCDFENRQYGLLLQDPAELTEKVEEANEEADDEVDVEADVPDALAAVVQDADLNDTPDDDNDD